MRGWLCVLLVAACADQAPPGPARERSESRARPAASVPTHEPRDAMREPAMGSEPGAAPDPAMQPAAADAAALASADPAVREDAVLAFEGDLAALAPLATGDPSSDVRRAAVQRLADGETPVARAALRNALEDTDPSVVVEAILALSAQGEPTARPALDRLRSHPDAEVRALAEETLPALAP